jgi:two-component system NtrC family sensor kinase
VENKQSQPSSVSTHQLQQKIILYSALGILTISIIVALVSIVPLYNQLKKKEENNLNFALKTRSLAVEQFLDRARDVADQISSRTKARQQLEAYNQKQINLEEFTEVSHKIINEALKKSVDVVGISRLDATGQLVLSVGNSIPPQFWHLPSPQSKNALVGNPIKINDESYLVVASPIINPDFLRVGTDIVLFKLNSLQRIIQDYTGLGTTGETVVGLVSENQSVELFFTLRNRATQIDSGLKLAMKKATTGQRGLWHHQNSSEDSAVFAYGPIADSEWGLVVKMNHQELYAPVNQQLFTTTITIIILIILGTGGMVRLLRPLTGQVIIQTDELEKQIEEKTHQLQVLLAEKTIALQDLKRTQSQLIHTEKMAGLGQIVAGIAHEINNPTNFIHGNINCLEDYVNDLFYLVTTYQKHCSPNHPEIDEALEDIEFDFLQEDLPNVLRSMRQGTSRIRDIVKSLRIFARFDEADIKAINIHQGIDSTLMILDRQLQSSDDRAPIQITKDYGELPLVECFPGELNQVFMNILVNAIDALNSTTDPPPNPSLQPLPTLQKSGDREKSSQPPTIFIQTQQLGSGNVAIKIKDNGRGIAPEVKDRIFDPFFTTKPVGKGTGLGLSVCHQIIVEHHHGQLTCVSSPEQGTEFIIEMPLKLNS